MFFSLARPNGQVIKDAIKDAYSDEGGFKGKEIVPAVCGWMKATSISLNPIMQVDEEVNVKQYY